MSELFQSILFAAAGGIMYDCMVLYKDYNQPKEQRVQKDKWYWFFMVLWPFAGVLLIYAYIINGSQINGFPAIMTGFTASTTFQSMLDKTLNREGIEESE